MNTKPTFLRINNKLAITNKLNWNEKAFISYILSYQNNKKKCYSTNKTIGTKLGLSEQVIKNLIKKFNKEFSFFQSIVENNTNHYLSIKTSELIQFLSTEGVVRTRISKNLENPKGTKEKVNIQLSDENNSNSHRINSEATNIPPSKPSPPSCVSPPSPNEVGCKVIKSDLSEDNTKVGIEPIQDKKVQEKASNEAIDVNDELFEYLKQQVSKVYLINDNIIKLYYDIEDGKILTKEKLDQTIKLMLEAQEVAKAFNQ